jgi:hypothetical protein
MHDDAHRTLLTILSPSAREHLRNVLIRNQADGGAIASQLLRNRDLRGWRGRTLLISSHSTLSSAARMSDSSGSWRHRVMSDRPEIDPSALERLSSVLVNRLDGLRGTTPSSPWSFSYILEATAEGWTAYKVILPPRIKTPTNSSAKSERSSRRDGREASKREQNPFHLAGNPRKHVILKHASTCGIVQTRSPGRRVTHPRRGRGHRFKSSSDHTNAAGH